MASRGINKVILVGNLGQDPEVRYTPNGSAIANLSLATSESWKDKNTGQMQEKTEWHRVSIFGKLAEIAGEYLRKGSQIYIEGKLQTRKWQDKQGQDRYTTEVVIDGFNGTMQMLGGRSEGGMGNNQNNQNNYNQGGNQMGGGQQMGGNQYQAQSRPQQQAAPQQQAPQQQPQQAAPADNGFNDSFDDDIPF